MMLHSDASQRASCSARRRSPPTTPVAPPRVAATIEMIALSLFAIAQRLEVGGERVSLDDLGPVIVNKDGSLRRIGNWAELTEHERAAAHRSISARNEVRLAALRAAENASQRRPVLLRPWHWLRRRISAVGNAFRFLGGRLKRWLPVCTAPNCIQ